MLMTSLGVDDVRGGKGTKYPVGDDIYLDGMGGSISALTCGGGVPGSKKRREGRTGIRTQDLRNRHLRDTFCCS
jgi:hypothetical protein